MTYLLLFTWPEAAGRSGFLRLPIVSQFTLTLLQDEPRNAGLIFNGDIYGLRIGKVEKEKRTYFKAGQISVPDIKEVWKVSAGCDCTPHIPGGRIPGI